MRFLKLQRKLYILLITLIAIHSITFAQANNKTEKRLNKLIHNGSVDYKNSKQTSSMIFTKYQNNLLFIPVNIDGKQYMFLFDTGAMISLVSKDIAKNSKILGSYPFIDGSGNEKVSDIIQKDISIGDIKLKNISCGKFDFSSLEENSCLKIDGILGANAIKLLNWKIDPLQKEIECSTESFTSNEENQILIEYQLYANIFPLVNVSLKSEDFWVLLDWGFSDYLQINDDFYNKMEFSFPTKIGNGKKTHSIHDYIDSEYKLIKIDSFLIDGKPFQHLYANINSEKPALGSKFLNNYKTILNTNNQNLILIPQSNNETSGYEDFGINFCKNESNELEVCFVWNESNFVKKENIKLGDKALSINGINTQNINASDWCELKNDMIQNKEFNVILKQENRIKDLTIKKEIIFK